MKRIAYDQMFANELTHAWYVGTREILYKQIKAHIKKKAKILDLGCGTGGTIKFLKDHGYKTIYGIDRSKYAINLCKKRGIKNIKIGSANKVPFKDNFFDAVICMDVLYHSGIEVAKATKEIARIIKIDGICYSQEPAYNCLRSKHDLTIETKRRFTKSLILSSFKNSGLKSVKISYFNTIFFLPIVAARIKDKIFKKEAFDSDVNKLPNLLNKAMLLSLRLETSILNYFDLPFGLSIISVWKK